jgi:lipopolysaccharide/colanic/teichoic acid biosynthesis glycosyltransferase
MSSTVSIVPDYTTGERAPQSVSAFRIRHSASVRRHALRVSARFALLLTSDIVALLLARIVLRTALERLAPAMVAQWEAAGPLAAPGRPASMVFGLALAVALLLTGSYGRHPPFAVSLRLTIAIGLAVLLGSTALAAIVGVQQALLQASLFGAVMWLSLLVMRGISGWFMARVWPRDRWSASAVAVASAGPLPPSVASALKASGDEYAIVAQVPADARLTQALRGALLAQNVEAVVVDDSVQGENVRTVLDITLDSGCRFLCPARALDTRGMHPVLVWHGGHAFLELGPLVLSQSAILAKRLTDLVGSVILLTATLPLMLLVAAAIRVDSHGPVLLREDRPGLAGRRFGMLKFRTTHHSRMGRILRRWSLDELPRFWNVLRGDMSLVGPQPFVDAEIAAYEGRHFHRLDMKPGVTGLWRVSGRSDVVNFEDVIFLDKQYVERWSFWLDVSILLRTIPAALRQPGKV